MIFEQGPIRPPSEAASLLIRVTRNCPWNQCYFCVTYRGEKFSRRPVSEIKQDILRIKEISEEIRDLSARWGENGNITPKVAERLRTGYDQQYLHVASWMYQGQKTIFLQDANSLIMKTKELLEVLKAIKKSFPTVERITTYARAKTARRKTLEELTDLCQAGLNRVHVGMESGSDNVLQIINKGASSEDMVNAGVKMEQAGISTCYYVLLGLGGKTYSREHALETARVLNMVNPTHIRFRTLLVKPGTPLEDKVKNGSFAPLSEDEIIREERLLIDNLNDIDSWLVSDHILNLLEEVRGNLSENKKLLLKVIDRYLGMPDNERVNFRLGRRAGVYRYLDDMKDRQRYEHVAKGVRHLESEGALEETIDYLRQKFL